MRATEKQLLHRAYSAVVQLMNKTKKNTFIASFCASGVYILQLLLCEVTTSNFFQNEPI